MEKAPKPKCVVCQGNLGQELSTQKLDERQSLIGGRKIETSVSKVTGLWCPNCGLTYKHAPQEFLQKLKTWEDANKKEQPLSPKLVPEAPMFKGAAGAPAKKKAAPKKKKSILEAQDDDADLDFGQDD